MKITKRKLQQIIREELTRVLNETVGDGELSDEEAAALRGLVGDAVTDARQEKPSWLPDVKPKTLPDWAEDIRQMMVKMKNTKDAVDYTNTNLQILDALESAGVKYQTGGMHIDELYFEKDGEEVGEINIGDPQRDATSISKAWADIVSKMVIK